jgi:hypothetical protein
MRLPRQLYGKHPIQRAMDDVNWQSARAAGIRHVR